jgi:hypothetical protein
MTSTRPPRLAVRLLQWLQADPMLVGDLLEEFDRRQSRWWMWRQVLASVPLLVLGRARETRAHRRASINLSASPRGSAIGGTGLLALAVLLAIVAPQIWWIAALAIAGGLVLGGALILVSRRRSFHESGDSTALFRPPYR